MTVPMNRFITFCLSLFVATTAFSKPVAPPLDQVRQGFSIAQACEVEIDDDLTSYGECIGHAVDRTSGQRLRLLGLYFQAWLMADLAARQGSTQSALLRQRYQHALTKSMRTSGWNMQQLCNAKSLTCETVQHRWRQKI